MENNTPIIKSVSLNFRIIELHSDNSIAIGFPVVPNV